MTQVCTSLDWPLLALVIATVVVVFVLGLIAGGWHRD